MEALENLLSEFGLSPAAAAGTVILTAILVFFAKRTLDRWAKQKAERRDTLRKYLREQEAALLKAYRSLYEETDLRALSRKEFVDVVAQADEAIMEPFTRYRAVLPSDVQAKIYDDIHSVLAQFRPDPSLPKDVKPEAVRELARYGEQFLRQIESVKVVVSKHLGGAM